MKTFTLGTSKNQVLEMIPEKAIHKIHLDENIIALVRIGKFFQADCPHRDTALIQGSLINQAEIICPLHEYRFDIKTGEVKVGSCGNLEIYATELTENGLNILFS